MISIGDKYSLIEKVLKNMEQLNTDVKDSLKTIREDAINNLDTPKYVSTVKFEKEFEYSKLSLMDSIMNSNDYKEAAENIRCYFNEWKTIKDDLFINMENCIGYSFNQPCCCTAAQSNTKKNKS